jgi:hypothetical protein
MSEFKHMTHKFRPVLTLEQIHHILSIISKSNDDEDVNLNKSIKKVLVPLVAKIEVGAINPAYKLSETHALKQAQNSERILYESGMMSPEQEAKYETEILGM